jgi:hypothetical protein
VDASDLDSDRCDFELERDGLRGEYSCHVPLFAIEFSCGIAEGYEGLNQVSKTAAAEGQSCPFLRPEPENELDSVGVVCGEATKAQFHMDICGRSVRGCGAERR